MTILKDYKNDAWGRRIIKDFPLMYIAIVAVLIKSDWLIPLLVNAGLFPIVYWFVPYFLKASCHAWYYSTRAKFN
jgi:hypothetical protein